MKLPVYLDYFSTTPVDPRVLKKMTKFMTINGVFGNPSSQFHKYGWEANEAVENSREIIASLIKAEPCEIIFTSGATESNNLALKGFSESIFSSKKNHIISSVIEHKTILNTCQFLKNRGINITLLKPDNVGLIDPEKVKNAINNNTFLVSLMHVNNEIGIINDIQSFCEICKEKGVLFHVDATQSVGKLPINLFDIPIDAMSFSGHKLYGPKGIGVLFVRKKNLKKIKPQILGGGHEFGIRSGTLPVHQIIGMGEACKIAKHNLKYEASRLANLRNKLWDGIKKIQGVSINGCLEKSIFSLLNISFKDIDGELLYAMLKNLAVSNGSACITNQKTESSSYVLQYIGLNKNLSRSSIRISIGRFTTKKEIDFSILEIRKIIKKLKEIDVDTSNSKDFFSFLKKNEFCQRI